MTDCGNYMSLNHEDLQEEYAAMAERYKQQIHELKRNLETANAAQSYLAAELELMSTRTPPRKNTNKAEVELEQLRRIHNELKMELATLQQEHDVICEERSELRKQLQSTENKLASQKQDPDESMTAQIERIEILEQENLTLVQQLDQLKEKDMQNARTQLNMQKNVEMLQEQVHCLEQNLQSTRKTLDEQTLLWESTQEQLAEANGQLAMLKTAPNDVDRKGNSLFAEVDDQRQVMKQLLAYQKKSYVEMKTKYDASDHEIRRLKRENAAMHSELQTCLSIFCNADKMYQEKLKERIRNLTNQSDELERKLKWTQERLRDVAEAKGVLWLDSMLNFCKQETEDLKQQVHSTNIQMTSLEEHIRNVEQEMARWRFETLRLRCINLNREHLLNEHKIPFKPTHTVEFRVSEKQLLEAKPNIGQFPTDASDVAEPQTSESTTQQMTSSPKKQAIMSAINESAPKIVKNETDEDKENCSNNKPNIDEINASAVVDTAAVERASILCKQRDVLYAAEKNAKNVHFAEKTASIPAAKCASPPKAKTTTTVITTSKSNLVVRRIIVGPRP